MPQPVQTEQTDNIVHEYYCQPQPHIGEVRTERYKLPRMGEDGITPGREVEIHRCMECGSATYDGVPERQIGGPPVMARPRRTD